MKRTRSLLVFLLTILLAFVLVPAVSFAAPEEAGTELSAGGDETTSTEGEELLPLASSYNVATATELLDVIALLPINDPTTINLTADITLTTTLVIPIARDIILTGSFKLIGADGEETILVDRDATLTIDGITVTHDAGASGASRGVYVQRGAFLYLVSGAISGNYANISGAGVYLIGSFSISGGTIANNTSTVYGGGVYMGSGSVLNMSAGTISDNQGSLGGGVYIASGAFTMTGGTISDNTAGAHAGGVDVVNGTFDMTGGTISGNYARIGGGIYAHDYADLTVGAGTVFSNNSADGASLDRDPSLDAVYATNIAGTTWTLPFTQGYNNYDIRHTATDYRATFDGNGGAVLPADVTRFARYGDPLGANMPPDPVLGGSVFLGWNTAADGSGTAFTDATTLTRNITVYAQWDSVPVIITYWVTFDGNGGDVLVADETREVVALDSLGADMPDDPTRAGFVFIGWNTAANGSGTAFSASTPVTDDITVYAQWDSGLPKSGDSLVLPILLISLLAVGAGLILLVTIRKRPSTTTK
ncbi:MAG: InlB B-repeat-containing protein [Coriobacteriia bacterium]|nr:InlB B-repeat-containing protein [Coriobacteriia bacterium]